MGIRIPQSNVPTPVAIEAIHEEMYGGLEINKARGARDTLVVVILEVNCIKDLVALHLMKTFFLELESWEPIEDQPLPADALPIALSSGYVVESDPEEDEEDPKEDPADYPADRGDNDDDESSNDDDDDDVEKDKDDEEEEEHLASADPFDVSTDDPIPSS
nr:hypothetical protein [Tanacetum cinerariifolium]